METNLKRALSIGVVCASMTSLLSAGTYDQKDSDTNSMHHTKAAVPPGTHPGEDGPVAFITADYTYWAARQAGLAYAVSNDYTATPSSSPTRGQVFYPNWTARSGFKVGAGAYLNHDMWDLYAQYTWFYNRQQRDNYQGNASFTAGNGMATWWIDDTDVMHDNLQEANAFWANWFNRVDVQLARAFYAGHYLQLRPFIGLLGAWDEQWFNIRYKDIAGDTLWNTWQNNQQWWGIGPYTGICSAFMFPMGDNSTQWSIFMDLGTSLPWSKSQVDTQLQDNDSSTLLTSAYTRDSFWNCEPMLETALGLRWETWWTEGMNWNFMLQAAWEQQVWFSHNHMTPIGTEAYASFGNYSMQGLTIKAKVGF